MYRFFCCAVLLVFCSAVFCQKVYFIYAQTESEQPFFVKINEKIYSSAATGYVIISNLKDSSYNIGIGFPQNKWPEQQFLVVIKSKDHGYLLKNFGEKGWGLFDLQSMGVQMATENNPNDKALKKEFAEVSAFTEILSKAANDPSLREKPAFAIAKKEETTANAQHAVVKEETILSKDQAAVNPDKTQPLPKKEKPQIVVKKEEVQKKDIFPDVGKNHIPKKEVETISKQQYKKSVVVKKSESSTSDGFGLTFIDQYPGGQKDTIEIIIPNPVSTLNNANNQLAEAKKNTANNEPPKEVKLPDVKVLAKNDCSSNASESDFIKLRKKMAGQKTDESMINEAKRGFKAKCYTIEQIKNLGYLFLNEAAKFQFYEAAYPYSNEKNNFKKLQSEFKDTYFIHRFNNLVK